MKFAITLAIAALTSMTVSAAFAQNVFPTAKPAPAIESISSADIVEMLSDVGFTANVLQQDASGDLIEVAAGGGTFYIFMRVCEAAPAGSQCQMVQPFANFNASGVTLGMVNQLVRERFIYSYAVLNDQSSGTIAAKIILSGGVNRQNVLEELGLFLFDVESLFSAITPGTIAQVNYSGGEKRSSGIAKPAVAKHLTDSDGLVVNATGAGAATFLTDDLRALISE